MPVRPAARRRAAAPGRAEPAPVHLLDGNLLYALIDQAHVHHAPARQWFAAASFGFATCPITQGTLLRLAMRLGGHGAAQALALLEAVTGHARHHFWPDDLPYAQVQWQGVMGHRQVTDAYLASLARHHHGKLASFDRGLVALHGDVGVSVG
ncbi:MAG: PIN domain-containing protein [Burkholderiales bacterium]|nr:PIN domain-containing protein [Burkholderiales bacterium]